jgi:hypothetical protein
MVPTLQQLYALSQEEMTAHFLSHILFHIDMAGEITRLGFKFSNNQICPP